MKKDYDYTDAGNHGSFNFRDDPTIEGPWRIYQAVDPNEHNKYIRAYVVFTGPERILIAADSYPELLEILIGRIPSVQ